jgi:colanic acid biosynthesis protein WcaH
MPTSALLQKSTTAADHGKSDSGLLTTEVFSLVVASAPLVAIDLIVEDETGAVLLGLRNNPPAQGSWFVPGGRIRKNESLDTAFSRIASEEIGLALIRSKARLLDVYEHFYDTNFAGEPGASTHYVVLAYRVKTGRSTLDLPDRQHSRYQWMHPEDAARRSDVHAFSRAYFSK